MNMMPIAEPSACPLAYETIRGQAIHSLLPELLGNPRWIDLTEMDGRRFLTTVLELGNSVDCEITRSFFEMYPQDATWVCDCYRILLKCLRHDWRIQNLLTVEPILPTIQIPDGRELRCGVPDLQGLSQTFNGLITIEMKSGRHRVRRNSGKLARYNAGSHIRREDLLQGMPFRGTVWISFSTLQLIKGDARWEPYHEPAVFFTYEPFNADKINTHLVGHFGCTLNEVKQLPRHYAPPFS
jgi:hypothetical protein